MLNLKKDKKMKKILFLSLMALMFGACAPSPTKEVINQDGEVRTVLSPDADIRDYGNGIIYFNYYGRWFIPLFSAFLGENREIEIISIFQIRSGDLDGYLVYFKGKVTSPMKVISEESYTTPSIEDYGNGVYFFSNYGSAFLRDLSTFLEENPELEIVSIFGHGAILEERYFVFFKKKME